MHESFSKRERYSFFRVSTVSISCDKLEKMTAIGNYFLRFPIGDARKELLSKWLHEMKRKGFKPNQYHKICSVHFRDTDFVKLPGFRYTRLKDDAIPSKFEFPEHLLKNPSRSRTSRTSTSAVSLNEVFVFLFLTLKCCIFQNFYQCTFCIVKCMCTTRSERKSTTNRSGCGIDGLWKLPTILWHWSSDWAYCFAGEWRYSLFETHN